MPRRDSTLGRISPAAFRTTGHASDVAEPSTNPGSVSANDTAARRAQSAVVDGEENRGPNQDEGIGQVHHLSYCARTQLTWCRWFSIIVSAASNPLTLSYIRVTLLMPRRTACKRNVSVGYFARAALKYASKASLPKTAPEGFVPIFSMKGDEKTTSSA
jgi:hypothetical protein